MSKVARLFLFGTVEISDLSILDETLSVPSDDLLFRFLMFAVDDDEIRDIRLSIWNYDNCNDINHNNDENYANHNNNNDKVDIVNICNDIAKKSTNK